MAKEADDQVHDKEIQDKIIFFLNCDQVMNVLVHPSSDMHMCKMKRDALNKIN